MYAAFVIAAILLSVAPMHARNLLAALPSMAPGHQFTGEPKQDHAARPTLPSAKQIAARPAPASYSHLENLALAAPPLNTPASRPSAADRLEHAPNAP